MSLEYLVGYKIEAVSMPLKSKDWKWALLLEGEVRIQCTDNSIKPANSDVEGCVIGAVSLRADAHKIRLFKGALAANVGEIVFTPGGYEIVYPKGMEPNVPDQSDVEVVRPPDPSKERVAEGPE
jgi:hypothetical protein